MLGQQLRQLSPPMFADVPCHRRSAAVVQGEAQGMTFGACGVCWHDNQEDGGNTQDELGQDESHGGVGNVPCWDGNPAAAAGNADQEIPCWWATCAFWTSSSTTSS